MVLTGPELIASLQQEVRILLHLASKVEPSMQGYRPTPNQRSVLELVRYLSMMGPTIVRYGLAEKPEIAIWTDGEAAAANRDFTQSVAAIATHGALYQTLLGGVSDATFRAPFTDFDGRQTTRGAFLVNLVLAGSAAYRMQLFLYLKAAGLSQLNSANLWSGADSPAA
ncbi:MAG: hypothetical protein ACKVZ0_24890 [Gemmatimonadales bacterium]